MILLLDNFDSFTWNLFDLVRRFHQDSVVKRNDVISIEEIKKLNPSGILISPGPGKPAESGICREAIIAFQGKIPILGICLGHQLIGEIHSCKIVEAAIPVHGKTSTITHSGDGLFSGLPEKLDVMRYHSLLIHPSSIPPIFVVSAKTETGDVMGIRHKTMNLQGLQFHPESILTPFGEKIISNWVQSF